MCVCQLSDRMKKKQQLTTQFTDFTSTLSSKLLCVSAVGPDDEEVKSVIVLVKSVN